MELKKERAAILSKQLEVKAQGKGRSQKPEEIPSSFHLGSSHASREDKGRRGAVNRTGKLGAGSNRVVTLSFGS